MILLIFMWGYFSNYMIWLKMLYYLQIFVFKITMNKCDTDDDNNDWNSNNYDNDDR